MNQALIGGTFVMGIVFGIVSVVALFTGRSGGEGSLKFGGIQIEGKGAPIVFLLVSAVLILAGFGYTFNVKEAGESLKEAGELYQKLEEQTKRHEELIRRIPPGTVANLRASEPALLEHEVYQPSKRLNNYIRDRSRP